MHTFVASFVMLLMSHSGTKMVVPEAQHEDFKVPAAACIGEGVVAYKGANAPVFVSREAKSAIFVNLLVAMQADDFEHVDTVTTEQAHARVTKSGTVFLMGSPPTETIIYFESKVCNADRMVAGRCDTGKVFQEAYTYIEKLHNVTIVTPITDGCPSISGNSGG